MTETNAALLAGFPSDVQALLARPLLEDTRLLELTARWEGLSPTLAGMAEALRLFVVTWDPLEWLAPRPEAVATASAWPVEIVVYVPVWSLAEMATRRAIGSGDNAGVESSVRASIPDCGTSSSITSSLLSLSGIDSACSTAIAREPSSARELTIFSTSAADWASP